MVLKFQSFKSYDIINEYLIIEHFVQFNEEILRKKKCSETHVGKRLFGRTNAGLKESHDPFWVAGKGRCGMGVSDVGASPP